MGKYNDSRDKGEYRDDKCPKINHLFNQQRKAAIF
jgi:hypothetical protein